MSSKQDIEATGYQPICVPNLGSDPRDCAKHEHLPGEPLPAPSPSTTWQPATWQCHTCTATGSVPDGGLGAAKQAAEAHHALLHPGEEQRHTIDLVLPPKDAAAVTLPPAMTQLADIPLERVQQAVKDLLGLDSLKNVIEVRFGFQTVEAVLFAVDENGSKYLGQDRKNAARHVLSRRVVR